MSEELERERLALERELEREKIKVEREKLALERERIKTQSFSQRTAAIISLISVAFGAVLGGTIEGIMNIELENKKRESQLFIQAIETGDPSKSLANLCALLGFGLIEDPKQEIQPECEPVRQNPPSLPKTSVSDVVAQFEGKTLTVYEDPLGLQSIGYGHVLTPEEIKSGEIIIEGNPVNFNNGITEEQALKLLNQDLEPIRQAVDELVTVPLTQNQLEALTSFAFNVGLETFRRSTLLKVLNEGKYEQVPDEMRKFARAGGRELPGLVKRREAEIELWNKAPSPKP